MDAEELKLENTYAVSWEDCCTAGSFTSKLVGKSKDDYDSDSLLFENGVTLTNPFWGVLFEEKA